MRHPRRAACAIWLAALLACPAAATAASVVVQTQCDKYGCRESLHYSAAPGEQNEVTVTQEGDLARKLSAAVASTAGDSARFGELPDWPTDSFLDALGVPH